MSRTYPTSPAERADREERVLRRLVIGAATCGEVQEDVSRFTLTVIGQALGHLDAKGQAAHDRASRPKWSITDAGKVRLASWQKHTLPVLPSPPLPHKSFRCPRINGDVRVSQCAGRYNGRSDDACGRRLDGVIDRAGCPTGRQALAAVGGLAA